MNSVLFSVLLLLLFWRLLLPFSRPYSSEEKFDTLVKLAALVVAIVESVSLIGSSSGISTDSGHRLKLF